DYEEEFLDFLGASGVQVMLLGHVTKGRITVDEENFGFIDDFKSIYQDSIGAAMSHASNG
ncbi:MAG: hypothetical protein ACKO66_09140, partial [Flavobacteriales bacterium]